MSRDYDCELDGHWFEDSMCVVCGFRADPEAADGGE